MLTGIVAARLSISPKGSISIVWAIALSAALVVIWNLVSLAVDCPSTILGEVENGEYLTGFFVNSNSAACTMTATAWLRTTLRQCGGIAYPQTRAIPRPRPTSAPYTSMASAWLKT